VSDFDYTRDEFMPMRATHAEDEYLHEDDQLGSPQQARPGTASKQQHGSPWVPPGRRPHSPAKRPQTAATGTRRNRAVEHSHMFLEHRDHAPADSNNFYWVYGAYEYKMQFTIDQARATTFRLIDKLMEKVAKQDPPPPVPDTGKDRVPGLGGGEVLNGRSGVAAPAAARQQYVKAHIIFDIISTKKHITANYAEGLPYQLGRDLYAYIDKNYNNRVVTTFVGLTDNTARRVGRDVYYCKTDDLSKNRIGFHMVDNEHMFIVFPPNGSAHSGGK
jgi:hypothetical protein